MTDELSFAERRAKFNQGKATPPSLPSNIGGSGSALDKLRVFFFV
jgi:hypothetical protein